MPRATPPAVDRSPLPARVAVWLLDSQRLGQASSVKRIAGRLLKHPARAGVVLAQSRLGQLLCADGDSPRDRRVGAQLLREAAKAGDCRAQLVLGRLLLEGEHAQPEQARHWLRLAAVGGQAEARLLLRRLPA